MMYDRLIGLLSKRYLSTIGIQSYQYTIRPKNVINRMSYDIENDDNIPTHFRTCDYYINVIYQVVYIESVNSFED